MTARGRCHGRAPRLYEKRRIPQTATYRDAVPTLVERSPSALRPPSATFLELMALGSGWLSRLVRNAGPADCECGGTSGWPQSAWGRGDGDLLLATPDCG